MSFEPDLRPTVLLIDDDEDVCGLLKDRLELAGYRVTFALDAEAGLHQAETQPDVIVLDVFLPDRPGPDLLPELKQVAPRTPVILVTGDPSPATALQTLTAGAFEFLSKADTAERLLPTVTAALQSSREPPDVPGFRRTIGRSQAMMKMIHAARTAVSSNVTVLIRGERGTGKEMLARTIHHSSLRGEGPFVTVHCSGLAEDDLDAELFGQGEHTGRLNAFELATGGTLVLIDVDALPTSLQTKMLPALRSGADVRVIATTHADLEAGIGDGSFRDDLYYTVATFTIEVPPLRHRHGDIALLAEYFAKRAGRIEDKEIEGIHPLALDLLRSFPFPGNVHQLESVITSATVSARGRLITVGDLPQTFLQAALRDRRRPSAAAEPGTYTEDNFPTLQQLEQGHLDRAMKLADGNKAKAARLLGISRMTLYRKIRDYQTRV